MLSLGLKMALGSPRVRDTGFAPSDISNLDIWYAFDELSGSNGDNVTAVSNKGGAGSNYDLSGISGKIPTLDTSGMGSINSVDFNASSANGFQLDNHYTTTDKTFTLFVVSKRDSTSDSDSFMSGQTGGNNAFYAYQNVNTIVLKCNGDGNNTNSHTALNCNNTNNSTVQYAFTTNKEILVVTRDASNDVRVYNQADDYIGNGTSPSTATDTNFVLDYIGRFATSGTPADGLIGELGIYNKVLSRTEITNLITHLKDKWSIS